MTERELAALVAAIVFTKQRPTNEVKNRYPDGSPVMVDRTPQEAVRAALEILDEL
jgi:lipid II:glycine glycyltransferase (peptidoglycan interpeptide bridge formation enzyme)